MIDIGCVDERLQGRGRPVLDRDAGDLSSAELLLEEAVDGVAPEDRTDAWRQAAAALARLLVDRGAETLMGVAVGIAVGYLTRPRRVSP